jgi:TIGR00730 family protein
MGSSAVYEAAAKELARCLVSTGASLVYGGGNVGLMGVLADEVLANKGQVIGVIPDFLVQREVGHKGLTQLEIVSSMHERKKRMADLSNAFIAMPGGLGTLDELAEILTWKQLGLIHASVGLLNTSHYFDSLISQMKTMVDSGFLKSQNLKDLEIADNPKELLTSLGVITV